MHSQRLLAAIMFTDIEGYTATMQTNEELAMQIRNKHRQVFNTITNKYHGRILQYYGDGTLSIFNSIVDAVNCAVDLQKSFRKEPSIPVRIGIHCGDVTLVEDEIAGDAVNIASRIETLAVPGSVLISNRVYEEIKNHREFKVKSFGNFPLKNVKRQVKIFAISNEGLVVPKKGQIRERALQKTGLGVNSKRLLAAAVVLFLVTLLYGAFLWYYQKSAAADKGPKSIAVLPFVNLSNDQTQDYFSDGMTADLLSQLSKINDLRVVSRTSVMQYKNTNKSIQEIAKELDATHILEGSVRKFNDQVRIAVNLIEAKTDNRIWSVDFDREIEDVLEVQRDVSLEVVKLLRANLTDAERNRVEKIPTNNQKAYDLFQRGQSVLRHTVGTKNQMDEAIRLFQQAIALDPNFSLAYVGVAETYLGYATWGRISPREAIPKAKQAVERARAIDDELGECYQILGAIYLYEQEYETAKLFLERAIELNPSYVESYSWMARMELLTGNLDETIRLLRTAQQLDPVSTQYAGFITYAYYVNGYYDEGMNAAEEVLKIDPNDNWLLWNLGNIYIGKEEYQQAIQVFGNRSLASNTNWALGYAFGKAGLYDEAQRVLDYQLSKLEIDYVPAIMISAIYMGMDRHEEAFQWLELAMEEGIAPILFPEVTVGPKFEALRSDPRFQELINRGIDLVPASNL